MVRAWTKKTYDLDGRRWREIETFGHVTRDELGFRIPCVGDWPGSEHVKVLIEARAEDAIPDLEVGDPVLILGDIRSWVVTMPILATSRGFEAACAEFGIKPFLPSQVTAVYRCGRCVWKEKR
jgi:hypothetical protein